MNTKLPIIAILLLLIGGGIFGGYYYSTVDADDGPCAALVSTNVEAEEDTPEFVPEIIKPELPTAIEKPDVTPDDTDDAETPTKPTPDPEKPTKDLTDKEKVDATKQKIQDLVEANGGNIDDETKAKIVALVEAMEVLETTKIEEGNFKHTVSGTVVDAHGQPVKGANVMLQIDSKESLKGANDKQIEGLRKRRSGRPNFSAYVRSYAVTDVDGKFSFLFHTSVNEGVESLNVTVHAQHASHLNSTSQKLTLKKGDVTTGLNFDLKQSGAISGRVVDGYGAGIKGARVSASKTRAAGDRSRSRSYVPTRMTISDADGNFKIAGLEDGEFTVNAWMSGYLTKAGSQHNVTVSTGQESYLAGDFILEKSASLSFTVVTAEGAINTGYLRVNFYGTDGKRMSSRNARVSKGGKVVVANVPAATSQFSVSMGGYEMSAKQYVSVLGGEEVQAGTVTLVAAAPTQKSDRIKELEKLKEALKSAKLE
ncbi:carboxypeptidase-like regulatory domain-containing protein [Planctomycetota bacterium]|nr:carboxypeptidase-like regulatory domain-containing protein [Planctomycetota bacterium]